MTPRERTRFLREVARAKRGGRDLWEHLDAKHMLLTDQRFRQTRAEVLQDLAELVEQATVRDILVWYGTGRGQETLADLHRAMVSMIRAHAKKETL